MADSKDITVPSAGNKRLQPDILALPKTRDFANPASDLRSGKFDTSLTTQSQRDLLKDNVSEILSQTSFRRGSDGLLRLKGEKESFKRGSDGLLRPVDEKEPFYRGSDGLLRATGEKEPNLLRPTISAPATTKNRDVWGDGPKSTLRPSKNSSAFGRAVPHSGYFPLKFKSDALNLAVGDMSTVAIANWGLSPLNFQVGSTTLQGMSWDGGQPVINITPNGTAATTTYHQAEDEGNA